MKYGKNERKIICEMDEDGFNFNEVKDLFSKGTRFQQSINSLVKKGLITHYKEWYRLAYGKEYVFTEIGKRIAERECGGDYTKKLFTAKRRGMKWTQEVRRNVWDGLVFHGIDEECYNQLREVSMYKSRLRKQGKSNQQITRSAKKYADEKTYECY